jgi:hypothetical protein
MAESSSPPIRILTIPQSLSVVQRWSATGKWKSPP